MKIVDAIKMPIYVAQLATGAKSFDANPLLGSERLNRRGLHEKRITFAQSMADRRRERLASTVAEEHRAAYARDGFVRIENFLPADVFEAVSAELSEPDFERFDMQQGMTITRRAMIDSSDLATRPGFAAAVADPRFKQLIRYVGSYGGEPLLTIQAVLAAAPEQVQARNDPQTNVHSDTFHACAKAWLFLKDVGEDDGPFAYVAGSHRLTPGRLAWERALSERVSTLDDRLARRGSLRATPAELEAMDLPPPVKMTAKANTLIVADTHGFHARSVSPKPTYRVEIYGSLRRNPFLPFCGMHVQSLPGLKGGGNRLMMDALKLRQSVGLKESPWRALGAGAIDEWPSDRLGLAP